MTKHRLCLLGDSHSAALLTGWRRVEADYPEVQLQVFATPGDRIKATAARGRAIIAKRPMRKGWLSRNGMDRIDIDAYDGFVVAGYGTSAIKHMALLRSYALYEYGRMSRRRQIASLGALEATVFDRLTGSKPFRWARRFRRLSGRPVFYVPTPRSASSVTTVHFKGRWPYGLGDDELVAFAGCVDRATEALCAEIGMILLRQPPSTLKNALFTKDEYRRDNDTSPIKRKTGLDAMHMNGAFGETVWRTHMHRILTELESADPLPAAKTKRRRARLAEARLAQANAGAAITPSDRLRAGPEHVPVG